MDIVVKSPSYWRRDRHFTCSSEPRERSYGAREAGTFSYFEILSIGPASGIEHATSRFAVNRSTDWANPAAVIIISGWVIFSNWPPLLFSSTKRSTLFSSGLCSTCYDHHKLLKGTPYQWKKKDRIAESSSLFLLCSTCKESLSFTFSILAYSRKTLHELNKIFVKNLLLVAGILQPRSNSNAFGYSNVWKTKLHERKQDCVRYKSASKSLVFKDLVD